MKKGIPARELRPFSIEDPFGLGIETPSQRKLRERFHRKVDRKRDPAKKSHTRSTSAPTTTRERRPAPTAPAPASAKTAPAKKSSAWGCLFTLVLVGVLWTLGQMFVPLIVGAIQQEVVLHTGKSGYGRILKARATDISLNDSTVYELTVEVHLPAAPPYQVEFKQGLTPAEATLARDGTWTTLRYDEDDRESIVLERLGVEPPALEPAPTAIDSQPSKRHDPFLKVDVRARAQVSTQSAPAQDQPPERPVQTPSASGKPNPNAPAESPRTTQISGSSPLAPAPAPTPEPTVAPPTPQASSKTASAQTVLPICRRAAACCTLAGGTSCGQFVTPGKEKRECNRAFSTFNKQATAAGKTCQ